MPSQLLSNELARQEEKSVNPTEGAGCICIYVYNIHYTIVIFPLQSGGLQGRKKRVDFYNYYLLANYN